MRHISSLILNVVALWVFILIYSLKGYDVEPIKPKELIDIKVDLHKELPTFDEMQEQQQKELKAKAFNLANSYIGKKGDCYQIAIQFIKELKGLDSIVKYEIDETEVCTGDLVFYRNNGHENTHWSVVLDLEDNIALHGAGQFDYKTYLRVVYEPNMSKPIFYRVEGEQND